MRILEIVLIALGILAFTFKLTGIPGGNVLLVFALSSLATFHFGLGFALFSGIRFRDIIKKGRKSSKVRPYVFLMQFGLGVLHLGLLFTLMFWPNAVFQLRVGLVLCLAALVWVVIGSLKQFDRMAKLNLVRLVFFLALSIPAALTSTDQWVDLYYGHDPEYAEIFKAQVKDSENPIHFERMDSLRRARGMQP